MNFQVTWLGCKIGWWYLLSARVSQTSSDFVIVLQKIICWRYLRHRKLFCIHVCNPCKCIFTKTGERCIIFVLKHHARKMFKIQQHDGVFLRTFLHIISYQPPFPITEDTLCCITFLFYLAPKNGKASSDSGTKLRSTSSLSMLLLSLFTSHRLKFFFLSFLWQIYVVST